MNTYSTPTIASLQRAPTNPRYSNFTQACFTAGDEEQFEEYRHKQPFHQIDKSFEMRDPVWNIPLSNLYFGVNEFTATNTFRYIFHKFKKGIFVQIRSGQVKVYLPFSNAAFINEWSARILHLPDHLQPSKTILPKCMWYANNYLFRCENPLNETDTGYAHYKHMLETLCKIYNVPDVEFFINRRDFPLLKQDKTEPYCAIYGDEHPLVSHSYDSYLPILSMVGAEKFADLPIPTPDDWARVCASQTPPIFFAGSKRTLQPFVDDFNNEWNTKKPIAVFRGSPTGIGVGNDNIRRRLCNLFQSDNRFDVGLTTLNTRDHIQDNRICNSSQSTIIPAKYLDMRAQSQYKYIIHIAGHVQSFRLSFELATYSCILYVESPYKLWYEQKLQPWVHYVPISADLSDLSDKLNWCLENDAVCEKISIAARDFYTKYLSKHSCLNYLYEVICTYRQKCLPQMYEYSSIIQSDIHFLQTQKIWNLCSQLNTYPSISSPILTERRCMLTIQNAFKDHVRIEQSTIFSNSKTKIVRAFEDSVSKTAATSLLSEATIGYLCTNQLIQDIPNFAYTFDYNISSNTLQLEYIKGKTLQQYIQSSEFVFQDWLCILKQLSLVFAVAQRKFKFTHHDACPWNIILYREQETRIFDYAVSLDKIIRLETRIVPILIDYGRSYAETSSGIIQTRGSFEPFKDCLCALISSAYIVVRQHHLTYLQQKILIDLFNIVLADFRCYTRCSQFKELVIFLSLVRKFSYLTFGYNEKELSISPMRLYDNIHVASTFCTFEHVSRIKHTNYGKISSIFEYPSSDPLFERYAVQKLWTMTVRNSPAEHYLCSNFKWRAFNSNQYYSKKYFIDKSNSHLGYIQVKNMLNFMLSCGGPFELNSKDKNEVEQLLKTIT